MFATLRRIFRDNWEWRSQIWSLAVTEIQKQVRGAALGWIWLIITPSVYVAVFWFALAVGLRVGNPVEEVPYLVWLTVGLIPWFFMTEMINGGSDVYRRYPYLVNRLRFPIPVISSFYAMAKFIIFLLTMIIVVAVMAVFRVQFSVYALQAPLLGVVMYLFWVTWSMWTSPLSALSKDFHNLIKAMSTPLFWVSGIIFNTSGIKNQVVQWVLAFNPVTFFAASFRASLVEKYWIWDNPRLLYPFLGVFLVMVIAALRVQSRLSSEIADVI
jgi:teichoic acid transport system permease protein